MTEFLTSMKNILLIIAILSSLTMGSCTQEYTCQCIVKYTGKPPGLTDSALHEFAIRDTKKEAKSKCEANSTTATADNVTMTEKCRLY